MALFSLVICYCIFSLSCRFGIYLGCKVYFIKEGYQGMVDGGKHIVGMEPLSIFLKYDILLLILSKPIFTYFYYYFI